MYEKLIYTNSAGETVEFSATSRFHVNIRKDVNGLSEVRTTVYSQQIMDLDGELETGFHVEEREITISGAIKDTRHEEQDALIRELEAVFSPFSKGVLRYEGNDVREIDVRAESAPVISSSVGQRWPRFSVNLVAKNPIWRAPAAKERAIAADGTTIYYEGSRACGILIEITANALSIDMESLTVTNGDTVETITFRTGGGIYLATGDVLKIDTRNGVTVTKNDVTALERIDFSNTAFPTMLYPGNNTIVWAAHGDEADFDVKVSYTSLYLGR